MERFVCGEIACNFTGNLIISLTFLTLTQRITPTGTFWLYAGILVIAWLFVYFMVPETAGLNLEAIQELFRTEATTGSSGPTSMIDSQHSEHHEEEARRRRRGGQDSDEL